MCLRVMFLSRSQFHPGFIATNECVVVANAVSCPTEKKEEGSRLVQAQFSRSKADSSCRALYACIHSSNLAVTITNQSFPGVYMGA